MNRNVVCVVGAAFAMTGGVLALHGAPLSGAAAALAAAAVSAAALSWHRDRGAPLDRSRAIPVEPQGLCGVRVPDDPRWPPNDGAALEVR